VKYLLERFCAKIIKKDFHINFLVLYIWATVNLLFFMFLVIRIFYFPTSPNLIDVWSFKYDDIPWTPSNIEPTKIFRDHYFGDFQLGIKYSSFNNPYSSSENEILPYGYLPLLHVLLFILSKFNLTLVFLFFLCSSVLLNIFTLFKIFGILFNKYISIIISISLTILNLPILVAIDRGNYVLLSTPAVALALYFIFYRETNYLNLSIVVFLLVFALLLKTYVLMILLILFLLKFFKIVTTTLFIFFFGNLIISLFYNSGPIQIAKIYLRGLIYYSDNPDPLFVRSGNGIFAGLARSIEYLFNTNSDNFTLSYGKYSTLLGILWFMLCLVIVLNKYCTKDLKIIYTLSNLQFFAPVSMFYTNIWQVFALAFCLIELNKNRYSSIYGTDLFLFLIRILIVIGTILSISVNPFDWYRIVSPLFWIFLSFFVLIYLGFKSFQTKRLVHFQSS
jgi:hypothetical protein